MANTPNLNLPLIAVNQAQKHVTANEAFRDLDGLVQLAVKDRDLTAPPGSPADGDRYLVKVGATGAWATWDLNIALYRDGQWVKLVPKDGWLCWVSDENVLLAYDGGLWLVASGIGGTSTVMATSPNGALSQFFIASELLSGLSGATRDSTITIPNGAIVFNVSERVVTTITGATSFSCGVSGTPGQFGSGLGLAAGSTNLGVIGPTAFYAPTPIRLTAAGGNFSGGAVRISIHYYLPTAPTS